MARVAPVLRQIAGFTRRRASIILPVAATALLTLYLWRNIGEFQRTASVIRRAHLTWLATGAGLELLSLAGSIAALGFLVRRIKSDVPWRAVAAGHLQRVVAAVITPISSAGSTLAFTRAMGRQGLSTQSSLLVNALNGVAGYGAFVALLIPVLITLELQHNVSRLLLAAAVGLILLFLFLVILTVGLLRSGSIANRVLPRLPEKVRDFLAELRSNNVPPSALLKPFAAHAAVEVASVAMLFVCLRAVGSDASLATALTAYVVGTTFLLVAPVFAGIGFVELGMVVVLHQFGVDPSMALAATLLYRAFDVWMPLLLGISVQVGTVSNVRQVTDRWPAIITFATGVLSVLSVIAPHGSHHRILEPDRAYDVLAIPEATRTLALVIGLLLIVLSFNLLHRKRIAWVAAVVGLAGLMFAHVLKRHDQVLTIMAGFNLLVLLVTHKRYRVRTDFPSARNGVIGFMVALLVSVAYGTIGFFLIDERSFGIDFSAQQAIERTVRTFFSLGDSGLTAHTVYGHWFLDSIQIVGVLAIFFAAYSITRPVIWRQRVHEPERQRAQQIIAASGDSGLDVFKGWDDKLFYFGSDGASVVSYGVNRGVAIALGDPVGPDETAVAGMLREFLAFCDANGWIPAFHQVGQQRLALYRDMGLQQAKIGEDAIVDLTRFTMSGGKMKSLRSNANQLENKGFRVIFHPAPLEQELVRRLRAVSDSWLQRDGRRERGFTLGSFEDKYVAGSDVFTVESEHGEVVAFANIIPDGAPGESTIDLMRHLPEPHGLMDFLFCRIFEHMRDEGFTSFSLGMAPFAGVGATPGDPVPERIMGQLYEHLNRVFSYKGLRAYKDKFDPNWDPRYVVYPSDAVLPLVAYAIIRLSE